MQRPSALAVNSRISSAVSSFCLVAAMQQVRQRDYPKINTFLRHLGQFAVNVGKRLGAKMLKFARLIFAVMLVVAASSAGAGNFNAQGQFIGTVSAQVTSLLAQFPGGGPGLRAAIAVLLETDPTLADDVVYASRTATLAQKQAIGMGVADAAAYFAKCSAAGTESCRAAEAALRLAMLYAEQNVLLAFLEITGSEVAGDIRSNPPIFIPGIGASSSDASSSGSSSCVSPYSPSGC